MRQNYYSFLKKCFKKKKNSFETLEQVQEALEKAGLESSNLIVGIDFTKSNTWAGKQSFQGRCLHALHAKRPNPYQRALSVIGRTLSAFDDDDLIPAFGFGDASTSDKAVFPFFDDRAPCHGVDGVLARYGEIAPHVQLAGPTSFAPILDAAVAAVRAAQNAYHILVIVADGQVTNERETRAALVRASHAPLSVICVGVGDGPFDEMHNLDDNLPARLFDNFQFVHFEEVCGARAENAEVAFALAATMELPEQYAQIKKLGLMQ